MLSLDDPRWKRYKGGYRQKNAAQAIVIRVVGPAVPAFDANIDVDLAGEAGPAWVTVG